MIRYRIDFRNGPGKDFVNIPERLNLGSILCTVKIAEATHSMTRRKQIELCFFCRVDLEKQALSYTASLSQTNVEGESTEIQNIHSLYLREIISSEANCKATNSEPGG